jgi:DNA repair exonuclease SbcCD ATPase subunit
MRNVVFKKAGAENFCCFKDPIELAFENNKVVIITGPNGVGKTTLFDIIPYTSYGITSKGLKGDDVVNDEVEKNCHTWYELADDENNIRVDRYVKHSKFGNTVHLHKNGVLIKKGHTEVLPEIERIKGPQKLFMNTLLFSQKVKTFFTDLTDAEQKDIFRKVLQLDDFVLWYNETNEVLKKVGDKLLELHNKHEIQTKLLEQTKESIDKILFDKKKFYEQKKEDLCNLCGKVQLAEISLHLLEEKINKEKSLENLESQERKVSEEILSCNYETETLTSSLNSIMDGIKSQRKLIESEYQKESQEQTSKCSQQRDAETMKIMEELGNLITMMEIEISSLDKSITSQDGELKLLESKKESLEKDLSKLGNLDSKKAICPTCKQPINLEVVEELKKHKEETENILKESLLKIEEIKIQTRPLVTQLERSRKTVREKKDILQSEKGRILGEYNVKSKKIVEKLNEKNSKLSELETEKINEVKKRNQDQISDLNKKSNELSKLQNQLKQTIQTVKNYLDEKNRLEQELEMAKKVVEVKSSEEFNESMLEEFKKKKDEIGKEILSLKESELVFQDEIEMSNFWKNAFSSTGIPSMLIDDAIPFMNLTISNYLEKIGGRYVVSFDTQAETKAGEFRDKIAVRTLDTKTKANSRKKLSGGQTRVVDIAAILTLCDLQSSIQNVKFNIMLFDEIFDSLDDENIGYISNLLRSLLEDKSIYIISHRQIDQIEADEILKFF